MRGIGREGVVQSACKGGLLFVCLLLAACSSRYDESHGGSWRGYSETGYASYYADRYHGKKTASSELYRNNLNSAYLFTRTGLTASVLPGWDNLSSRCTP